MKQIYAKILKNENLGNGFRRIGIAAPYLAKNAKPGQFVELRCSGETDPLLRRPFGVHRVTKGGIELLYEIVGRGTEIIARKKPGEILDLIGPLGTGFVLPSGKPTAILVAGGNGVAPILFLSEVLAKKKVKQHVLIGGRSKSHILCEKDFKRCGARVSVTTEDGSKGHKGLVTHILKELLADNGPKPAAIYACGPTGMLKAVANIARTHRVSCQVSLEEKMACGVGVCLGCPVKVKRGHGLCGTGYEYKMVCKDGPVFDSEEIYWE
ncbi:MAG: dihydroorotate dehydrogenase electron transfer subunit [Candidatus Omnitrophica bacterium]|nr:dihydroorotate dehydrogenase electron transfer subunit [Candidatus Omnitrophota bacterium]